MMGMYKSNLPRLRVCYLFPGTDLQQILDSFVIIEFILFFTKFSYARMDRTKRSNVNLLDTFLIVNSLNIMYKVKQH